MTESCVLEVGTEVSAKYRGAFCEATIKHVKKLIKIRISWNKPLTGSATVTQDNIRGVIKVHSTVEVKKDNAWCAATVLKITDASTYTVVFDDGDERTLGRNSVCPQGAKHFNEEWTLDHLPLTNPENFGTPVIMDSKKQRKRRKVEGPDSGRTVHYSEEDVGKVVFYDTRSGKKQTLVPVLIASPGQCPEFVSTNPGEVIVRSFKSGKFMSIPKEDMVRFDRDAEPLQSILSGSADCIVMKPALEKALAFYDTGVLPGTWESDTDTLVRLKEPDNLNNSKMKKQFTSALSEFWEKKGSPITRQPSVGYHDLDLYYLHCYVTEYGGPQNVTQSLKWRSICAQMNILDIPATGSHTVRNAYCKFVVPFLSEWNKSGKITSVSENVQDTPVARKKGRSSTPVPLSVRGRRTPTPVAGIRTGTPTPVAGIRTGTPTPVMGIRTGTRRNSVKIEADNESVASDTTDYESMPDIHKYNIGQRVKVLYGAPKHCGSYEAKINDKNIDAKTDQPVYHIHYTGWNTRHDEWIAEDSILSLVTRSSKKKGTLLDPPKDLKSIPSRRKIIPKYKRLLKKQQSTTSETSSDDKNSLAASESSESEQQVDPQPTVKEEDPAVKSEEEDKPATSSSRHVESSAVTRVTRQMGHVTHHVTGEGSSHATDDADDVKESESAEQQPPPVVEDVKCEPVVTGDVTSTQVSQEDYSHCSKTQDNMATQSQCYSDNNTPSQTRDDKSPLLCDENFADCLVESAVSSTQQTVESPRGESRDALTRDVTSRDKEGSRDKMRYHHDGGGVGVRYHDNPQAMLHDDRLMQENRAKEEAAAILMTFPSTFAMKGPITSPGSNRGVMVSPSNNTTSRLIVTSPRLITSPGDGRVMTSLSPGEGGGAHQMIPPHHLQFSYQYPVKGMVHRFPISPSKDSTYITTSGCPTQYLTTNTVRPIITAAGISKISSSHAASQHLGTGSHVTSQHVTSQHVTSQHFMAPPPGGPGTSHFIAAHPQSAGSSGAPHYQIPPPSSQQHPQQLPQQPPQGFSAAKVNRFVPRPGGPGFGAGLMTVTSEAALQSNININMLKLEEKKKGRKRKIQQADSTSDIGSRLQQFDFRPEPCEDCDKRADERPRRTERDKARRGTVKNSEGGKSGDRGGTQQPPYWIPGSVVGSSYVRSSSVPLYYSGSDVIQGGYYVPMRPPGIGPYPPGYSPKFPLPIPKSVPDKDAKSENTPEHHQQEQPSSSGIREPTQAEPDSTVSDDKSPGGPITTSAAPVRAVTRPGETPPHSTVSYNTPPYNTPPYCTPPHTSSGQIKPKSTPNIDSDSSDEKTTAPGMSPMILTHSTSECSDKEGTSSKVKIFDKDFGIHLFDHLELPDKIKSLQSTMAELQKCYFFYKGQISAIEKKERGKRKWKKRRKSKQRTSSLSKYDKLEKVPEKPDSLPENLVVKTENTDEKCVEKSEQFSEVSEDTVEKSKVGSEEVSEEISGKSEKIEDPITTEEIENQK